MSTQESRPLYGSFYKEWLSNRDPINIELHPQWRRQIVFWPVPVGGGELSIRITDGGQFNYNVDLNWFEVWIDPTRQMSYEIFDRTSGLVIHRGTIVFGQQPDSDSENEAAVNWTCADGIKDVMFISRSWVWMNSEKLDSHNELGQPVAVYPVHTNGTGLRINYDQLNGTIKVYGYVEQGQMPELKNLAVSGYGTIYLPPTHQKFLVVITADRPGFSLGLAQDNNQPPAPTQTGGGLG